MNTLLKANMVNLRDQFYLNHSLYKYSYGHNLNFVLNFINYIIYY